MTFYVRISNIRFRWSFQFAYLAVFGGHPAVEVEGRVEDEGGVEVEVDLDGGWGECRVTLKFFLQCVG